MKLEKNEPVRRPGGEMIRSESNKTYELNLDELIKLSGLESNQIDPLICDMFTNREFVKSIHEEIKNDPVRIGKLLRNCTLFKNEIVNSQNDIFGELINIPEIIYSNGYVRRAESGQELVMEKIKNLGIDTSNVLFFRRTQLAENPEHYWTSDYWETYSGLRNEISGEQRKSSVILCSTLEDISSDSKLIHDINDDSGLSVRRETQSTYDQKRALFVVKT